MASNKEKLFTEFQAPTKQEWLDKIQVDLKGADFNKKLVWKTNEGFDVQPFYRREDVLKLNTPNALPGEYPFVRGNKKNDNTWYVRQNINAADAVEANKKALYVIERGVNSVEFCIPSEKISAEFVENLLQNINCEAVEVNFKTCNRKTIDLVNILVEYYNKKQYNKELIVGSVNWDPIEKMVMGGKDTSAILEFAPQIINALKDYPNFRCINVNSEALNNAGAYISQELGYALAWGNEYINILTEAGLKAGEVARRIKFNMGVSENYFMEIAKFRAARMLWAEIVNNYDGVEDKNDCKMCVNATTSKYNMTVFDSYVNMLRSQTETMSAAIAGVHSIVVTPFNAIYEKPTDFSERIARNQQLLLKEESHFDKVVDPSAGSYCIEELTNSLASAAWNIFLNVEENGGFYNEVKAGNVQDVINKTNEKRHSDVAKRKEFILGTNQYPNFTEQSEGKTIEKFNYCGCNDEATPYKGICATRLAADFEELRLQTENAKKVPVAFMLTIGSLVWRQARAQFSSNFLACAGYKIIDNIGFKTIEEGVDAAMKAEADIIVLCSSDDEYAEYAVPTYKYINNKTMFVVAGAPANMEDLKAEGIENFIHVKCNVLETLKEYNSKLGIK